MEKLQSADGSWSCARCTLENSHSSKTCDACGNTPFTNSHEKPHVNNKCGNASCSNSLVQFKEKNSRRIFASMLNDVKQAAGNFLVGKSSDTSKEMLVHYSGEHEKTSVVPSSTPIAADSADSAGSATGMQENNIAGKSRPKLYKRQTSVSSIDVRRHQEEGAIYKWQDIVTICKELKTSFVDDSFPPSDKSLTFSGTSTIHVRRWLRPAEISIISRNKVPWEVFRNPRPSDIIQGIIGNCWFLSALAVVSEKQELLEQIVITKTVCNQGVYQVRICKNGNWEIILVDDFFPCDVRNVPAYSQAARSQLWVPLIEKAFAKSVGCYEGMSAGRCIEALQMLTGMPCESILLQNRLNCDHDDLIDIDMVWAKILTCRNAGYLMGASCGGDVTDELLIEQYHQVGLEAQHAYSVLDVQQVDHYRLIRLRNPWGRFSWTGAWSDNSPIWTEEFKRRLHPLGSEEGVFWISLDDMMNYFDTIDVCKYQPDSTEVSLSGNFASPLINTGQVCLMTVFAATEVDITLFQESNRGFQNESLATLDLMVAVYRAQSQSSEPKPLSFITHSNRKVKPSILCNVFLDEGIYVIIPFAFNHWNNGTTYLSPPKYVLSIHSSKAVLADQVAMVKYSYSDALFLMVEKLGKRHEGISGVTCYYLSHCIAGLIVTAENRRTDVHLHVSCDCSNSFNVVATRGSLITNDCLPPLHRQILTVLTQLEGGDGYSVSHKLRFRTSSRNAFNSYGSHQDPLLVNGLGEVHNPRPL